MAGPVVVPPLTEPLGDASTQPEVAPTMMMSVAPPPPAVDVDQSANASVALPEGQKISGKVKTWLENNSYGFIMPDSGGPDIFVHRNQLQDGYYLTPGNPVMFEARYDAPRGKYTATSCSGASGGAPPGGAPGAGGPPPQQQQVAVYGGPPPQQQAWGPQAQRAQDNLFVAGMPSHTTDTQVYELFGRYGTVQQVKILPDQPGKPDKAALVRMSTEQEARWMVENLNGNIPVGLSAPVVVKFAGDRSGFGKGGPPFDNRFQPYGGAAPTVAAAPQIAYAPVTTVAAPVQQAPPASAAEATKQAVQHVNTLIQLLPPLGQNPQVLAAVQSLVQHASGQAAAAAAQAQAQAQAAAGGFAALTNGATAPAADASGWVETLDPSSGKSYFYHSVTREVSWDRPGAIAGAPAQVAAFG